MTDSSFAVMTITACSTKRVTSTTSGYVTNLTGLLCTPLAPVGAETMQRLQLNTPHRTWEVHLQGAPDIKQGDKLLIGSTEYPVLYKEPYTWLPSQDTRMRLIVEDLT